MSDPSAEPTSPLPAHQDDIVLRVLGLARRYLGLEVAWLSRLRSDEQLFTHVDAGTPGVGPRPGEVRDLRGSYCIRVLDGRLPPAVPDTANDPVTASLQVTRQLGLGAYVGVPVRSADGAVMGMLCCASGVARPELEQADLTRAGAPRGRRRRAGRERHARRRARGRPRPHHGRDLGPRPHASCCSRSSTCSPGPPTASRRSPGSTACTAPDVWFAQAEPVGLRLQLELAAARSALAALAAPGPRRLPQPEPVGRGDPSATVSRRSWRRSTRATSSSRSPSTRRSTTTRRWPPRCGGTAPPGCVSRSTTRGPGTPACGTSSSCAPTSSRSTCRSSGTSTSTPSARRWSPRWSPSRVRWAPCWWPRASRRRPSSTCSSGWACGTCRATCCARRAPTLPTAGFVPTVPAGRPARPRARRAGSDPRVSTPGPTRGGRSRPGRRGRTTHPGLRRPNNEDSAYVGERLLVVADGMGGVDFGEVASAIATHALTYLDRCVSPQGPEHDLAAAVEFAEFRLGAAVQRSPELAGMGTTLTALLLRRRPAGARARRRLARLPGARRRARADHPRPHVRADARRDGRPHARGRRAPPAAARHRQGTAGQRRRRHRRRAGRTGAAAATAGCCAATASATTSSRRRSPPPSRTPEPDGAVGALVAAALEAGAPDNVTCVVADVVRSPAAGTGLDRARRTPRSQLLGAAAELDPWGTPATGGSVPAGQAARATRADHGGRTADWSCGLPAPPQLPRARRLLHRGHAGRARPRRPPPRLGGPRRRGARHGDRGHPVREPGDPGPPARPGRRRAAAGRPRAAARPRLVPRRSERRPPAAHRPRRRAAAATTRRSARLRAGRSGTVLLFTVLERAGGTGRTADRLAARFGLFNDGVRATAAAARRPARRRRARSRRCTTAGSGTRTGCTSHPRVTRGSRPPCSRRWA